MNSNSCGGAEEDPKQASQRSILTPGRMGGTAASRISMRRQRPLQHIEHGLRGSDTAGALDPSLGLKKFKEWCPSTKPIVSSKSPAASKDQQTFLSTSHGHIESAGISCKSQSARDITSHCRNDNKWSLRSLEPIHRSHVSHADLPEPQTPAYLLNLSLVERQDDDIV